VPARAEGLSGAAGAAVELARRHRGPIVQATEDPRAYDVTFVFVDRTGTAERAVVFCPALPGGFAAMRRLGSRVFTGTFRLPAGTRVKYHFCPDPPAEMDAEAAFALEHDPSRRRIDYLNPVIDLVTVPELRLRLFESMLELPGGRPASWSRPRAGVRRGTVETATVASAVLGAGRRVSVYLPPSDRPGAERHPLVLLVDGQHDWWKAEVLFDNLLADGAVPPFVAVLLGAGRFTGRLRELAGNPDHVRFVTAELLPWLYSRCALTEGGHVVAGFSAGALGAAYLALCEPLLFARVVAVSGTFQLTQRMDPLRPVGGSPWLLERYDRAGALPRSFYLAAGAFETSGEPDIRAQNEAFAAILRRRGVDVRFDTGPTGHDTHSARAHLADGLAWTLGR
jgi:enterochelin esterase-like enzyme